MVVTLPDFSALTAAQFFGILALVALVDWLTGVIGALRTRRLDPDLLLKVLWSQGVFVCLPIGGAFAIGQVGGVPAMCLGADGALAIYVALTLRSSYANLSAPVAAPAGPTTGTPGAS